MLPAFTFPRTGVEAVDRVGDLVAKAIKRLLDDPSADYFDVSRVALVTGASGNTVPHGLGRIPSNFVVTYASAQTDAWMLSATVDGIVIRVSANATLSLRVW